MSTLKFTLPLTLSIHPGRRHARHDPRPSTPREGLDGTPAEGVEPAPLDRSFKRSHAQTSHLLHQLRKSIRRGFIGDIDMALSFVLEASKDDKVAPVDPFIDAAPEPVVQSQICPACEAANDPAAKFCNQCGTAFTPAVQA
ncbi:MAG TPA: zinc ribbon domain-containing protein [Aquabacterium sp.]|uniref:zinc ribbon domain-containing protein n=1 Tax=Aquabacterium sp. TaxID=1872578 RepID=UPI002E306189|nr:zinc ribbon domain-containing protein [Aquabacterium sp.]HEX5372810.1 zinc ribbon domain-containing protein [Aquabacterium sp.]